MLFRDQPIKQKCINMLVNFHLTKVVVPGVEEQNICSNSRYLKGLMSVDNGAYCYWILVKSTIASA